MPEGRYLFKVEYTLQYPIVVQADSKDSDQTALNLIRVFTVCINDDHFHHENTPILF